MDIAILVALTVLIALVVAVAALLLRGGRGGSPGDAQAALAQNAEQFLTLAEERLKRQTETNTNELDNKKQLIDQQLEQMNKQLESVRMFVNNMEKDRVDKFSELGTQLKALTTSTTTLREALSSTKARGQWGERMAEDILRSMGLKEGFNYEKQVQLDGASSRPDFGFLLPGDLRLNMDVKFPLDNYLRYLNAGTDVERDSYKSAFLRDARNRVKEVTGREYIDPKGGTVRCVLLFIPNESIYAFLHEHDSTLIEYGLENRVICCSPLTLFAVLLVIRPAVDNFALRKAEEEIIGLIGQFNKEWREFKGALKTLGKQFDTAQGTYEKLTGRRQRALERPLVKIEDIRQQRGITVAEVPELSSASISDLESTDDEGD